MKGPFEAGQRVRIHWAKDNSVLEGDLVDHTFESPDDLSITWGNQMVHFWMGLEGTMSYIFSLDDVTIEILSEPGGAP